MNMILIDLSFISLIKYNDGEYRYILAPQNLTIGNKIISDEKADITMMEIAYLLKTYSSRNKYS